MASQSKIRSLFSLKDMSISQKLLLAFIIIGLLIAVQSYVISNSINTTSDLNDLSLEQSEINRIAFEISEKQQEEASLVGRWVSGFAEEDQRALFDTLINETEELYTELERSLIELNEKDIPTQIDIAEALNIFNQITSFRNSYIFSIEASVFTTPSLSQITEMEQPVFDAQVLLSETTGVLTSYILNHDNQSRDLLNTSLSTSLPSRLDIRMDRLETAILVVEDLDISLFIDLQDFQEHIEEELVALNAGIDLIVPVVSQFNSTYDITNLTQSEFDAFMVNVNNTFAIIDDAFFELQSIVTRLDSERIGLNDAFSSSNLLLENILDQIARLTDWTTESQKTIQSLIQEQNTIQRSTVITIVVSMVIALIVILLLMQFQVAQPISSIAKWSQMISDGDLSKTQRKMDRTDEIGQLRNNFRNMTTYLRDIILEVQKSSAIISTTSDELATNTQEINATAEEVSAIAQTMAKGSTEQAEIITTIVQELQRATEVVDNVSTTIIDNLGIIKGLSEQTNVLALNTAIEAANAGDVARGFQVIAENIRKMAEQSKRTSQRVSKDSRVILDDLKDTFSQIAHMIENVASVSEETAASAEEVAASAEEMTASMESIASGSSLLSDQSSESLNLVKRFRLEEE